MCVGGSSEGRKPGVWGTVSVLLSHDLFNTSLSSCPIWSHLGDTSAKLRLNLFTEKTVGGCRNKAGEGRGKITGCKWDEHQCELRRSTSAAFSRKHCHGCETLSIYRRCSVGWTPRGLSLTFYWANIHFLPHADAKFGSVAHFTSGTASARDASLLLFFLCHVCGRAADQCVLILRTEKHQRWARRGKLSGSLREP